MRTVILQCFMYGRWTFIDLSLDSISSTILLVYNVCYWHNCIMSYTCMLYCIDRLKTSTYGQSWEYGPRYFVIWWQTLQFDDIIFVSMNLIFIPTLVFVSRLLEFAFIIQFKPSIYYMYSDITFPLLRIQVFIIFLILMVKYRQNHHLHLIISRKKSHFVLLCSSSLMNRMNVAIVCTFRFRRNLDKWIHKLEWIHKRKGSIIGIYWHAKPALKKLYHMLNDESISRFLVFWIFPKLFSNAYHRNGLSGVQTL